MQVTITDVVARSLHGKAVAWYAGQTIQAGWLALRGSIS
jgi:uncharacterized membrane protein